MKSEKSVLEDTQVTSSTSVASSIMSLLLSQDTALCPLGNRSKNLCLNPQCSIKSPFICIGSKCSQCPKLHAQCFQKRVESFVNLLQSTQTVITKIQEIINSQTEKLIDKISNQRDNLIDKLKSANDTHKLSVQIINSKFLSDLWSDNFKKFNQVDFEKISQEVQKIKSDLEKHVQIFFSQISAKTQKITALEIRQKIVEKITLKDQEGVKKIGDFTWSEQLNCHKVSIKGTAVQHKDESDGQRFALMDCGFSSTGTKKQIWGIKIKKACWVGVGISLQETIKKQNYNFNYSSVGHGNYLISTNGYSWSHSAKDFNYVEKAFKFGVNDTVYVEYDPTTWKLRFRKNLNGENFQLAIDSPPANDTYHPCVCLYSKEDSAEIVLPGIPLSQI